MRKKKFRCWDNDFKEMIYGIKAILNRWDETIDDLLEDSDEWIGLKDRSGRDIYEGDILKVVNPNGDEDNICIVEYDEEVGAYPYEPKEGYGDYDVSAIGWAITMGFEFEIIGNIYENSDLLKEK